MKKETRFEIIAQNGQVLEHGFVDYYSAAYVAMKYKIKYKDDNFEIREYDLGKYGLDNYILMSRK